MSLLLFVACTTTEESPSSVPNGGNESVTPSITLEQNYLNFDEHADVQTISFSSTMDWTAELINDRADGWCSISATSGSAGSKDIDVTVTENTSTDDRTASVIIKSGAISKTVRISQKQRDALTVTSSTFEIEGTSGKIYIEVKANVDFEYTINGSAAEWITPIETRAMKTTTLGFNIAENKTMQRREGTITIHSGDLSETVTVYQKDHGDAILLSQNEYVVSDTGEDIAVEVTSNVDVEIEMPDVDWITRNTSRAVSTNTYYFTIAENTTYDQREAYITFKNTEKKISERVKVSQVQKDAIVLAKSEYEIELEGGALDFDIQTNVEVSVSISEDAQSWITQLQTRGLETRTLYFDIATYDGDATREGTITISGGNAMQTITICQRGIVILDTPNYNEIYYTTNDRKTITPNLENWDETIISNIYDKELGYGIITFNGDIETIGGNAFHNCSSLKSIKIPESVTEIGGAAFYECSSLTDINIPQNVTIIGEVAFASCVSLKDITIPDSVTQIEYATFCDCLGLESITIPEGVTTIGDRVFEQCRSLTNVTIPANVTKIGESTFKYCENLATVTFEGNKVEVISPRAFQDCSSLTDINLPEGVITIGDEAFRGCSALTSINIPASITFIGIYAFDCENLKQFKGKLASNDGYCIIIDGTLCTFVHGSGLTEYTIPDNVTTIGECAFEGCNLTNITIPDNVTSIGRYSFRWGKFTSITIPKNVTWIGEQAFAYSNLTSLYCRPITPPSAELSNIIDRVNCTIFVPIESIDAYRTAESWKEHANKIVGYDFDSGVEINPNAQIYYTSSDGEVITPHIDETWEDAEIISNTYKNGQGIITFSKNITQIGYAAFRGCTTLTSIEIPKGVTTIGDWSFYDCSSLTSIKIPDSVTTIGYAAIYGCSSLKNIEIPESVTTIAAWVCAHCRDLTSVYCKATTPPSLGTMCFYLNGSDRKIYVPKASAEAYKSAENWSGHAGAIMGYDYNDIGGDDNNDNDNDNDDVVIDPTTILNNQIYYTSSHGNIVNPSLSASWGGANIVSNTYENGHGVITFDKELTTIGVSAFSNCSLLTSVIIPNKVTRIESSAFNGCKKLTSLTLGSSVVYIGRSAFNDCNLTSVTIPNSVTTIEGWAFRINSNLATLKLGKNVKSIGDFAFYGGSLVSVEIPSSVETIETGAFNGNPTLVEFIDPGKQTGNIRRATSEDKRCLVVNETLMGIADGGLTEYELPAYASYQGTSEKLYIKTIGVYTWANVDKSRPMKITLPEGVTKIEHDAFWNHQGVQEITLPKSITMIDYNAFAVCINLSKVYCKATIPPTMDDSNGYGVFYGNPSGRTIYVPRESVEAYKSAPGWSNYADAIQGYDF